MNIMNTELGYEVIHYGQRIDSHYFILDHIPHIHCELSLYGGFLYMITRHDECIVSIVMICEYDD